MSRGFATVQRMRMHDAAGEPCFPFVEHRTRDMAVLLADVEWGWSRDPGDAYVFTLLEKPLVSQPDDYERCAEAHIERLKEEGEKCRVWACTFGEQGAQERALRNASRLAQMESSIGDVAPVVPEPEFEEGGRPPIRKGKTITERIHDAKKRRRAIAAKASGIEPEKVYVETSRRLGEHGE